jgi:hypothetical protein
MIEDYSEYKLNICNLVSKSQIVDDCIYNNNYFNTFFTAKNTKKLDGPYITMHFYNILVPNVY